MADAALISEATACARLGLKVHPAYGIINGTCTCRDGASCRTPGKHPVGDGWQRVSTSDATAVAAMFRDGNSPNVGIQAGLPSSVVVMDVDPRNGGDETLFDLEAQYGNLPDTREVLTGGGGRHIYLRHPGPPLYSCDLGPGLELKADTRPKTEHQGRQFGANVLGPGSLHASGRRYCWEISSTEYGFAPIPGPWLAFLREASQVQEGDAFKTAKPFETKYPDGQRYRAMLSLLGTLRKRGLDVDEMTAMGVVFGEHRFTTPSTEAQVRRIAEDVCRAYPAGEVVAPQLADNKVWSHAKLMAADFAPPAFVVQDLVADAGLTVLGGKKKLGKSRLCLQLAVAVASGTPFLCRPTIQGPGVVPVP